MNTVIMLRAVGMITLFLSFIEMIRFLTILLRLSVSIRSSKQVISVGRVPGNALFTTPVTTFIKVCLRVRVSRVLDEL